jgi:hypothetical protein
LKRLSAKYREKTQDNDPYMFDKIIDHLYLGDEQDFKRCNTTKPYLFVDARGFFNTLSGDADANELMVYPLMVISKALATLIGDEIDVFVYCQAGMERSPFLVALILNQMGNGTIEECYDFVKSKHPQTIQYSQWVEGFKNIRHKIKHGVN